MIGRKQSQWLPTSTSCLCLGGAHILAVVLELGISAWHLLCRHQVGRFEKSLRVTAV
jgi:hypothetical protein